MGRMNENVIDCKSCGQYIVYEPANETPTCINCGWEADKQYDITWAGIYRVFRVANRLVSLGGELNQFDINTYKFLFEQLDSAKKQNLVNNFGNSLKFIFE